MSIALLRARSLRRATIVGAAAAAALLLSAGPALAHITISPASAPAGSTAVLTLHVPNEEASADTVKLDVQIPTDHPIAQLLVQPVPGWSVSVRTITLAKPIVSDDGTFSQAVSEVIWSGGKILPGQFQDFSVSADPLPTGVSQLAFKAIQTYSNGDVVRWIDLPEPGVPPAHPAPMITLTTAHAPARAVGAAAPRAASSGSGADGIARILALAGLLVGLLAGLLSLMAARQARRLTPGPASRLGAAAGSNGAVDASEQVLAGPRPAARRDQPPAGTKSSPRRDQPVAGTKASARRPRSRRRG